MKELSPWRIRRLPEPPDQQPEYAYTAPPPDDVHLSHYWNILVKRRRIVIIIFLSGFLFGAYFPLKATKLYTAAASIQIEPQTPQVMSISPVQPIGGTQWASTYDYYQTQFALLKSSPLAARVIMDLGLDSDKGFGNWQIISPNPLDHIKSFIFRTLGHLSHYIGGYVLPILRPSTETRDLQTHIPVSIHTGKEETEPKVDPGLIGQYLGFLQVAPVEKTRLVRVRFTTPDPGLSQALANAHVQAFIRTGLESRFGLTKEAREFLQEKVVELRQQMEQSEAALNKFRRAHGVISVEKGENIVIDRLVELNKQLTAARAQRIEAESLYRTVENKNYRDLSEVMKLGLVPQLNSNLANLEAEKSRLSTIFKEDHPRIQELNQHIRSARQALNNEIANVVRGLESNYVAALNKERNLEAEAKKQEQAALNVKEVSVDYTVLEGAVKANRAVYESVLKRLSETNVANEAAFSNFKVVAFADRPESPSSPNIPLHLIASMISAFFFGVGAAFVREYVDSSLATPDDVARATGLGTFGVVPHLKFLNKRSHKRDQIAWINSDSHGMNLPVPAWAPSKELIISHSPISIVSESYRTIRTSLLLSQAEKPPQVVLFTSPAPGEGKTTTALNLSIALAQDGYSVLIIDADMRKGCCHSRLGLRNNKGLSNVLTGGLPLTQGVQPTSVVGLSLLSRGLLPPNPSELLGSNKMREVLYELRQSFQFILIDSPPVVGLSDATVLSVMSDGVLLVINGQNTSTPAAQKAVERLDMVRAPLLGAILHAIDLNDPHYSYYQNYSSYYAYEPEREAELNDKDTGDGAAAPEFEAESKTWQFSSEPENERFEESPPNGWKSVDPATGAAEAANDRLEPVGRVNGGGNNPSAQEPGAALSPESLNRLIQALTNTIGPIAPLVVREQIATLGESERAFPKSRIHDLLKLVEREISRDELIRFKEIIPEEFRETGKP